MTLISFTQNDDTPMLLGDILITSNVVSTTDALPVLPSFPGGVERIPFTALPISLKQKVYFITDNLAVAFSGREDVIYRFLTSLNRFKNTRPTREELASFIDFISPNFENRNFSALIAHFEHPTQEERQTLDTIVITTINIGNFKREKFKVFGEVHASGSGADEFMFAVEETSNAPATFLFTRQDNPRSYVKFITSFRTNLKLISDFLGRETLNAKSLLNRWGCGFELAYVHPEELKFEKLDNYTLIIWKARFSEGKFVIEPHLMMKHLYWKDQLIIWSTNFINPGVIFPVGRIDSNYVDLEDLPEPDFNSPLICYTVVVFLEHRIVTLSSAFDIDVKPAWVTISNDQGKWVPRLSKAERKRIEGEARKANSMKNQF